MISCRFETTKDVSKISANKRYVNQDDVAPANPMMPLPPRHVRQLICVLDRKKVHPIVA